MSVDEDLWTRSDPEGARRRAELNSRKDHLLRVSRDRKVGEIKIKHLISLFRLLGIICNSSGTCEPTDSDLDILEELFGKE